MPRRVALDVTPLLGPRTGIGVFTGELATRLAARPDVEVRGWATTWRGRHELADVLPAGVRPPRRALPAGPARALWARWDHPRIERWTGPVDVVHGTAYVVPPTRAAAVVSVHDLSFLSHPSLAVRAARAYPALLRRAARRGAFFHVDADAVGTQLVDVLRVPPERVITVPLAPSPVPEADLDAGRALAGSDRYVLALGTVEPRKDLPGLVRAFDEVAAEHPELHLVVAGPDGWGAEALTRSVADSAHRDRIVRLGWVDRAQRAALLRGASVLAYPSLDEGFGLPPLEAMSVGVPVVTTDVGALPETCGDGATLVAPGDPSAFAQALARVLDDDVHRVSLVERGHVQVARFSWDRTVDGMLDLYRRATTYTAPASRRRPRGGG